MCPVEQYTCKVRHSEIVSMHKKTSKEYNALISVTVLQWYYSIGSIGQSVRHVQFRHGNTDLCVDSVVVYKHIRNFVTTDK